MVVYVEIAILENFILDGILLYLAVKCAREKVCIWRLLLASAAGAGEAVLFPLLTLPDWAAYAVKIAGGILLILIAVRAKRIKPYLIATLAFFFLTFALGGLLTATYSFFGVEYAEGGGYLVERAPVGLVFGLTLVFAVAVTQGSRAFYRYRQVKKNLLSCTLTSGERVVNWQGLADSGNCLQFRGKPVCVVSAQAIFALFGRNVKETGRMTVSTVNGTKDSPVFECERMKIITDNKTVEREGVYLTVGDVGKNCQLVLHTAILEA